MAATSIIVTRGGLPGRAAAGSAPAPTRPAPPTTGPGSVITITGGPSATANIPGPHNDPGDFFGIALGLVAIVVAVVVTRLIFRRPRGSGGHVEGPR